MTLRRALIEPATWVALYRALIGCAPRVLLRRALIGPANRVPLRRALIGCAAAVVLSAACSGSGDAGAGGESDRSSDLTMCERERLAAALGLSDPAELSLPLDPGDEPLADIARDVCALRSDPPTTGDEADDAQSDNVHSDSAPSIRQVRSPAQQRDVTLPASLVRAPALYDPDDAPPGDDAALDELWTQCGQGSASACNSLLFTSPAGSDYEAFAFSCGGRENLHCSVLLGDRGADAGLLGFELDPDSAAPGTIPDLDRWWRACGGGSSRGCAQLVLSAPGGSVYASFGWTCGGRTTRDCALLVGDDGPPPALAGRSPENPPPGDDSYLDQLWDRCGAADALACRDLATFGPPGSDYERFALSCGWRAVRACARLFAELAAAEPEP
ncbi:hypothetical protein [Candidatus Poriferisodalis sp.]|uniref:hypothetical protein n=1 Tax=Candidatus Poriferisodalis sp. TaxID=3101277 RepID=UPI003B029644